MRLQAVNATGTAGEYMRLGCVVNTLLTFFELDTVTITVEGRTLETGHEMYDYPLGFFENQTSSIGDGDENYEGDDLSDVIANLPRSDAVDTVWNRLLGYWNAEDNLFIVFESRDGLPGISFGMWETGYGSGFGELIDAKAIDRYKADLTIWFPAKPANMMEDAREELTVTVGIDVNGLEQDGKINIKIEILGHGGWYAYAYGGATSEEAYESFMLN